ncbi:hypothetical protein C6497_16885 [Candidatus Poribacteria bacterium]|nr:MAG: hypothetical protein C6497_16885 [Candidatus Poribacteria bacterium]
MQNILDYFVSPLVFPVYVAIVLYILGLPIGRFFADVFIKKLGSKTNAIENGTMSAWRLVTIIHFITLTIFVIGLCIYAFPNVSNWPQIFLYLISYVPFAIIDIFILISLATHRTKPKRERVKTN